MGFDLDQLIKQLGKEGEERGKKRESALEEIDEALFQELFRLCAIKEEEFRLMGYDKIDRDEIFSYIKSRHRESIPPLHRLVGEILSVKPNDVMNWLTLNAYRGK